MPPEGYRPQWMDPEYFRLIREAQERAFCKLMRDVYGIPADPKRPIERRSPSKASPATLDELLGL